MAEGTSQRLVAGGLFICFLTVITGCGIVTANNSSSANTIQTSLQSNVSGSTRSDTSTSGESQPKWKEIRDVVLANSIVPGHSGQHLELVDVQGKYAMNPIVGPFQGDNWVGQFQLRVVNSSGRILSQFNLPSHEYALFMSKFQFQFADYNGDGYLDFALGQRLGNNGYWYELFTIKSNKITQLKTSPTAQLFASTFTYSPLFQKVDSKEFQIKYYDNSKAQWLEAKYVWNNGEFEQSGLKAASPGS